jgi:RNA polymerase sigma-70 factor (family 1)
LDPYDSILKKGLREGDKEVFKLLFINYSPALINYGSKLTKNPEIGKELVQDLFLELWEKRNLILIKGSLKTYLFSSIYHRGLNWLRAQKIREIYANNPSEIGNWFAYPIQTEALDPLKLDIIENQISLLPEQCREVFTRSVINGDKLNEIADYLGLTTKTVENHLARARKILRERLKKIR